MNKELVKDLSILTLLLIVLVLVAPANIIQIIDKVKINNLLKGQENKVEINENKVIEKEDSTEFKDISFCEYENLFDEDNIGLIFVYVGRPTCSYCQQIQPLLKQLQSEENIVFNYLNTDTLSEDNFKDLSKTSSVFAGEWGTPTLLAIINGKVHSNVAGYREIVELRTFVKTAKNTLNN